MMLHIAAEPDTNHGRPDQAEYIEIIKLEVWRAYMRYLECLTFQAAGAKEKSDG